MIPVTLCRQLGRHWAAHTSLDPWTFVEPDDSNPGNVYACAMPQRGHRLATAAALVPIVTAPPQNPNLIALGVEVLAVAATIEDALGVLGDLAWGVLFPDGRTWFEPATATRPAGLIGLPVGAASVWRIVELQLDGGPVEVPGARIDGLTDEGQRAARLDLRALVTGWDWAGE